MLEAGNQSQIKWGDGNWIILDVGFSGGKGSRGRTCGLLMGTSQPERVAFGEATKRIVNRIGESQSLVNLVIEAPLSVCFSPAGNPTGRTIEKKEDAHRYWFTGAGCAVMVASMYLVKAVHDTSASGTVRLFEAFVSYKKEGSASDHAGETTTLREVIRDPRKFSHKIIPASQLKARPDDDLRSAFHVIGIDCGVPAVIML